MTTKLKPWSVMTLMPRWIPTEVLGVEPWIRQMRAYAWAPSRAAFARMLIETGVSYGSEGQVSREIRDYGADLSPEGKLAAQIPKPDGLVTRVYVAALDTYDGPLLAVSNGRLEVPDVRG